MVTPWTTRSFTLDPVTWTALTVPPGMYAHCWGVQLDDPTISFKLRSDPALSTTEKPVAAGMGEYVDSPSAMPIRSAPGDTLVYALAGSGTPKAIVTFVP